MFIIILRRGHCLTKIYTFANHILYCLQEAENEVLSITEERDRVLQDLQSAMANNEKELAERYHYY
jgi:Na+/phosphate symporter